MKNFLILMFVVMLNACVSAEFPEIEESKTEAIESDSENALYEDVKAQPRKPVFVEETAKSKVFVKNQPEKKPANVAKAKKEVKETVVLEKKPVVEKTEVVKKTPSVEMLIETIYFADGASSVNASSKEIKDVVKFVKANDAKIKIFGHSSSRTLNTDPVSHKMANFSASLKRAQNAKNALIKAGVDSKDIIMVEALSDSRPAYQEVMPEGERLNRRVEIYVIY